MILNIIHNSIIRLSAERIFKALRQEVSIMSHAKQKDVEEKLNSGWEAEYFNSPPNIPCDFVTHNNLLN